MRGAGRAWMKRWILIVPFKKPVYEQVIKAFRHLGAK